MYFGLTQRIHHVNMTGSTLEMRDGSFPSTPNTRTPATSEAESAFVLGSMSVGSLQNVLHEFEVLLPSAIKVTIHSDKLSILNENDIPCKACQIIHLLGACRIFLLSSLNGHPG